MADAVKGRVWSLNREAPISELRSLEQVIGLDLWQARLQTLILGLFAAFAILLAAVGLYGVIAYSVGRRTQEIGIRMALGATAGGVVRLVLAEAVWLILIGVVVGMAAALALARSLGSLLYGVTTTDPANLRDPPGCPDLRRDPGRLPSGAPCLNCRPGQRPPLRVSH